MFLTCIETLLGLAGLLPVVSPTQNGLMGKDGFISMNNQLAPADANNARGNGIYKRQGNASDKNYPSGASTLGLLICFTSDFWVSSQLYISTGTVSKIYARLHWDNWNQWAVLN